MTARRACPPAPGPLEEYAACFDDLLVSLAQRRGFREYPAGLLPPRERNKTLTALAGAEPVVGARQAAVQRLQFFLSEATWDADRVNDRRLGLLAVDPATGPHEGGVRVVDDTGHRTDGHATAGVGRQYPGSVGLPPGDLGPGLSIQVEVRLARQVPRLTDCARSTSDGKRGGWRSIQSMICSWRACRSSGLNED